MDAAYSLAYATQGVTEMIELNQGDALSITLQADEQGRDSVVLALQAQGCELSLTPHQARVLATELIMAVNRAEVRNNLKHNQILHEADLWELRSRRPLALSVGQQQRTALAACLSLRPRLLILDEPTLGQDWGHLQRLMNYIQTLNRQGATILLISHDYKLVHHYAHRVILLREGRIEQIGSIQA